MPGEPTQTSKPDDRAWFLDFVKAMPDLITEYGIKPNPVDLRQGLDNVQAGLAELQASLTRKRCFRKLTNMLRRLRKCPGKS